MGIEGHILLFLGVFAEGFAPPVGELLNLGSDVFAEVPLGQRHSAATGLVDHHYREALVVGSGKQGGLCKTGRTRYHHLGCIHAGILFQHIQPAAEAPSPSHQGSGVIRAGRIPVPKLEHSLVGKGILFVGMAGVSRDVAVAGSHEGISPAQYLLERENGSHRAVHIGTAAGFGSTVADDSEFLFIVQPAIRDHHRRIGGKSVVAVVVQGDDGRHGAAGIGRIEYQPVDVGSGTVGPESHTYLTSDGDAAQRRALFFLFKIDGQGRGHPSVHLALEHREYLPPAGLPVRGACHGSAVGERQRVGKGIGFDLALVGIEYIFDLVSEGHYVGLVLVRGIFDLAETPYAHLAAADIDVGGIGFRKILPALEVEELGPGFHVNPVPCLAGDLLHQHVTILLGSVGTHLQPEYAVGTVHLAVAENHVAGIHAFAAEHQGAGAVAEAAILYQYPGVRAIVGISVRPGALPALQGDEVISRSETAALDMYVRASVEVDAVGTRGLDGFYRGVDIHPAHPDLGALVEMYVPECGIAQAYAFDGDVGTVADAYHPRAAHLQVGAGGILLPAGPEGLPIGQAAAVDGTLPPNGEAPASIRVHKGGHIGLEHAFDVHGDIREIPHVRASLQHRTLLEVEMSPRLEEKGPGQPGALGDYDGAAPYGSGIDGFLYCDRLEDGTVTHCTVGKYVEFAGLPATGSLGFLGEPTVYRTAVRPAVAG